LGKAQAADDSGPSPDKPRAGLKGAAGMTGSAAHYAFLIVVQHGDAASTALQRMLVQLQRRCDFSLVHVRTDSKPGFALPDPNVAVEFSGYQDGLARALAAMAPDRDEPMTLVFTNDTAAYSHVRRLALQVLEALVTLPAALGQDRVVAGLAMPADPALRQVTQSDLYLSTWAFALRARPSILRGIRLFDEHETLASFAAEVLPSLTPQYLTWMRQWLEPVHSLKGWYKAIPGVPLDDVTRERKRVAIYLEHRLIARMAQQGFVAIDVGSLLRPQQAAVLRHLRLADRARVNWLKLRLRLPAMVRARLFHRLSRKP